MKFRVKESSRLHLEITPTLTDYTSPLNKIGMKSFPIKTFGTANRFQNMLISKEYIKSSSA